MIIFYIAALAFTAVAFSNAVAKSGTRRYFN